MRPFNVSLMARSARLQAPEFAKAAIVAIVVLTAPAVVFAQDEPFELEDVVVVGSRTVERSLLDSAVPVAVFSREELLSTGAAGNELGEALAIVAPSFNFPRQSNSVTSDHIRAAQIHGLSPDQVLVLVNGKRRHPSAVVNDNTKIGRGTNAVDFNTIPLSAVKRVEILYGGASAQYGSDAIAGVINIVLLDSAEGGQVSAGYGVHHTQVDPINETVTDGQTFTAFAHKGVALGADGFAHFGFEYHNREPTNRAGFDQIPPDFIIPQVAANLALEGQRNYRVGDPESEGYKLWFNAALPIAGNEFYAFGTYAQTDTLGAVVFRYPIDDQNLPSVYPSGYLPRSTGDNQDVSVTAGMRRELGAWHLDNSITFGRNEFEFGVENSLNPSLGPDSPRRFESGTFTFDQLTWNLDVSRSFELDGLTAPLNLAAGLAYRHETFESEAGEPASYRAGSFQFDPQLAQLVGRPAIGAQGAQGLRPADEADERRDVFAAYAEVSNQLSPRLYTALSGRVAYYSDFGEAITGKASAIYTLSPAFSLRGSVSNSFRAPSLSQIGWARRTTTFGPDGDRVAARLVRSGSPIARALGVAPLEEEQSQNASAGLVFEPQSNFSVTIDAFFVEVDDRITLSEGLEDDGSGPASLTDLIQGLPGGEDVESVSFFTNAVDTRTRGVDIVLNYARELGAGRLTTRAAYSYADTEVTDIEPASQALQSVNPNLVLVGLEEINTIESATPDYQFIFSAVWDTGSWRLLGRVRHFGSVVRVFSFARQEFGAETAFDAEVSYLFDSGLRWRLGASNLFDNYPDESNAANNFFGNFAYDILSPIGINGRFIYSSLTLNF